MCYIIYIYIEQSKQLRDVCETHIQEVFPYVFTTIKVSIITGSQEMNITLPIISVYICFIKYIGDNLHRLSYLSRCLV